MALSATSEMPPAAENTFFHPLSTPELENQDSLLRMESKLSDMSSLSRTTEEHR
jgi:hypothetical protein